MGIYGARPTQGGVELAVERRAEDGLADWLFVYSVDRCPAASHNRAKNAKPTPRSAHRLGQR